MSQTKFSRRGRPANVQGEGGEPSMRKQIRKRVRNRIQDKMQSRGSLTTDPIVHGLLQRLPEAGAVWPQAEQANWIAMLQTAFKVLYKEQEEAKMAPPRAVA